MSPNAFTMPRLLAFSAPAIPLALLLIPLTTLLPTYYSQTTGLDLKSIGLIFLVARLFDGIIDPVIGVLSDRTPPEFGRRRSWMIAGALLAAFGCWLVFFPAKTPSAISLTLALAVLYTGWTMIAVPFFSWTAELSRSYSERSRIAGIRDACYFFGVILGAILIGVLTQAQNGLDPRILTVFGIVSIVTLPALVTLAIFVMPEARHDQHEPQSFAADLKEAFSVLADNPPLRRLLTIFGFAQMAAAISNTLSFLYVQKFQDAPQSVGVVVLVYFAATVAGLPLWVQLSYRVTKHIACAKACIVLIVSTPFCIPIMLKRVVRLLLNV